MAAPSGPGPRPCPSHLRSPSGPQAPQALGGRAQGPRLRPCTGPLPTGGRGAQGRVPATPRPGLWGDGSPRRPPACSRASSLAATQRPKSWAPRGERGLPVTSDLTLHPRTTLCAVRAPSSLKDCWHAGGAHPDRRQSRTSKGQRLLPARRRRVRAQGSGCATGRPWLPSVTVQAAA